MTDTGRATLVRDAITDLDSLHRGPASAHLGWRLVPTATDGEAQDIAWQDVNEWVAWLVDNYEFADWPTCWHRHPGLVQEAIALRLDHASVIAEQKAHDLVVWHESVDHLRKRVAEIAGRCDAGERCSRRARAQ